MIYNTRYRNVTDTFIHNIGYLSKCDNILEWTIPAKDRYRI